MVKARVRGKQLKAQSRFNAKKKARIPRIFTLYWVRFQQPHWKNKLHTFWSQPQQVQKQLGPVTFQLSDGFCWHANQLRRVLCPSGADHTWDTVLPCSLLSSSCPLIPAQHPVTPQATTLPLSASQGRPTRLRTGLLTFRTT